MALGSLQPEERFGLIAFGSSAIAFDKRLQPANRKNLEMARRWINCLDDMGGDAAVLGDEQGAGSA